MSSTLNLLINFRLFLLIHVDKVESNEDFLEVIEGEHLIIITAVRLNSDQVACRQSSHLSFKVLIELVRQLHVIIQGFYSLVLSLLQLFL